MGTTVRQEHPAGSVAHRSAWRTVRSVGAWVLTILLLFVFACAIALAVMVRTPPNGGECCTVLGHPVMSVLSGSMSPVIQTGDMIVDRAVTPAQAANLEVGTIISFKVIGQQGQTLIFTHRIVGIVRNTDGTVAEYKTKGDANQGLDQANGWPSPQAVVGVYDFRIPRGGYILGDLHKPVVLALLFAAPVLWFVSSWLFRKAREIEEDGGSRAVEPPPGGSEAPT